MNIRKDCSLYRDMTISNTLCAVAAVAIVLATLLEFNPYFDFEHIGFIINVLLGLSASSAISFICIYFPARSKRDSEIRDITEDCTSILLGYKTIISQMPILCEPFVLGFDTETDSLFLKRVVLDKSNKLIEKIKTLTDSYKRGEIESKEVTLLLEKYNKGLCNNLETITDYFDAIISFVKSDDTDEDDDAIKSRYKRLMNGFVSTLLRILEEDCPYEDLEKAFKDAFPQSKCIDLEYIRHLQEELTQNLSEASNNTEEIKKLLKERKLYSMVKGEWEKDKN